MAKCVVIILSGPIYIASIRILVEDNFHIRTFVCEYQYFFALSVCVPIGKQAVNKLGLSLLILPKCLYCTILY